MFTLNCTVCGTCGTEGTSVVNSTEEGNFGGLVEGGKVLLLPDKELPFGLV